MRLIFVHGIKHEKKSSDWIKRGWLEAICRSLSPQDAALIRELKIDAPYYGDVLHAHAEGLADSAENVSAQSGGNEDGDELTFYREALAEVIASPATFITATAVEGAAADPVTEMGLSVHNRHLIAMVRALETVSPLQGSVLLRFLPQAFTYLNRIQATRDVDSIVWSAFEDKGPAIVVAHSLGSVVSFKLMRDAKFYSPLYVTIGSPLGIRAVQGPIGHPLGRRPGVERWCNFYDTNDFVTLSRPLAPEIFGQGVENCAVENASDDPHSYDAYLAQPSLGQLICETIKSN